MLTLKPDVTVAQTKINWTNPAFADLLAIEEFLGESKRTDEIIQAIFDKVELLKSFPLAGPVHQSKARQEHRFLISGYYKIIYQYENETVHIRAVFDTRQDPGKLKL